MKNLTILLICLISTMTLTAQNLNSKMDTLSYSVGVILAQNLKQQGLTELDTKTLASAIDDVLQDNDLKINAEEAQGIFREAMMAKAEAAKSVNQVAGEAFLAKNGAREVVNTLESGLQYEVITKGAGPSPAATDKVTVHYHGMLIDGTVFDSSVERGSPASFPVNGVIPGWVEALQLMAIGDKWKLVIPASLAYGERGAGGQIGPNSTLIFEVELLKIN
ncbi:MAG: FKBP-type peptidyl-prolyl cis-trans isomerase FklB [Paraglaciecola sp.]|jgi:FKBP-type peptidyl-prolyl cis-trans isomerase FklB